MDFAKDDFWRISALVSRDSFATFQVNPVAELVNNVVTILSGNLITVFLRTIRCSWLVEVNQAFLMEVNQASIVLIKPTQSLHFSPYCNGIYLN